MGGTETAKLCILKAARGYIIVVNKREREGGERNILFNYTASC